jgi:hypothetical protein
MQSLGGTDPGRLAHSLSEIQGVRLMYSGLAFVAVALAMLMAVLDRVGRGKGRG